MDSISLVIPADFLDELNVAISIEDAKGKHIYINATHSLFFRSHSKSNGSQYPKQALKPIQNTRRPVLIHTNTDNPSNIRGARKVIAIERLGTDSYKEPSAIDGYINVRNHCPNLIENLCAEFTSLTKREIDVLGLLIQGMSAKEIASSLKVSPHTVADHTKIIYQKLDAHSRGQAVYKTIRLLLNMAANETFCEKNKCPSKSEGGNTLYELMSARDGE